MEDLDLLLPSLSRRDTLIVKADLKGSKPATVGTRSRRYVKLYSLHYLRSKSLQPVGKAQISLLVRQQLTEVGQILK